MDPECGDECCPGCTTAVAVSELGVRDVEDAAYNMQLQPNTRTLIELVNSWNRWNHRGSASPESELALLCLESLHYLKLGPLSEEAECHDQDVIDLWPVIFKWITIVYSSRFREKHLDSPSITSFEEEAISAIGNVLLVLSCVPTLPDIMAASPGILKMVAFMWVLDDKVTPGCSTFIGSSVVATFLLRLTNSTLVLDNILAAAGNDPDVVLRIACARIEQGLGSDDLESDRSLDNLAVLAFSASAAGHQLRRACLKVDVIPTCLATLKKIGMLAWEGNVLNSRPSYMIYPAFSCVLKCLITGGYFEVLRAVKCGLFEALLECYPYLSAWPPDRRDDILAIVVVVLPPYLVFRKITRAIYKVLSRLVDSAGFRRIKGTPTGRVLDHLRDVAARHHSLLVRSHTTLTPCDNEKCMERRLKSDFRACNACHFAWYCSQECQKMAWRGGNDHKGICSVYQRLHLESKPVRALRNKTFMYELSLSTVRSVIPDLPEVIKERYPSFPLLSLVVIIDFLVFPPTCTIHSGDEVMHTRREIEGILKRLLATAQFAQCQGELLVANYIGFGDDGLFVLPTSIDLNCWGRQSVDRRL
ncbi:hypothetical protein BDN72DRAFT_58043 [Pluteus cervinus]|uniref:Uncharacterized protein n=1 Tax=Pluteus cervinus TaxID=181527 RepID=A0ACD3BBY6_9AGAR|nr:hypothetical protein BDN72DRAFT_58043 [Pluteus cervinus]